MHWKFKLTVPMDHISIYMCLYKCKINMNVFNIFYIKIAYPTITYVLKKKAMLFSLRKTNFLSWTIIIFSSFNYISTAF